MNDWLVGAASVLMLLVAFIFGWIFSASTISHECKKVGAFYISDSVYECRARGEKQ